MEVINSLIGILLLVTCYGSSMKLRRIYDDNNGEDTPFFSSENLNIEKAKTKQIAKYLSKFGYTRGYTERKEDLRESLKDFQFFGGLIETGELDSPTEALMKMDRCDVEDPSNIRAMRLRQGGYKKFGTRNAGIYTLQGTKWMKNVLTWRYKHNPNGRNARMGITEDAVCDVMRKAMALWEEKTNIKFVEDRKTTTPDVWILFASRNHGDPYPFDGREGTLAHAFYPLEQVGLAGDVHFDDDEEFTIGSDSYSNGRDLNWVAVHELGHTLGLDHSSEEDAIMFSSYPTYKKKSQLHYYDTIGIQSLYGGKIKRKTVIPDHKRCRSTALTAVFDYKKDFYMAISEHEKNYLIHKRYKGMRNAHITKNKYLPIPNKITAVFNMRIQPQPGYKEGLFDIIITDVGDFYVSKEFEIMSGPHSIYDRSSPLKINFPYKIKKIDAAMKWWVDGKVYFFAGNNYWRYDENRKQFDEGYQREIDFGWIGVPSHLDAAYSSKERKETFSIKGNLIYRLQEQNKQFRVEEGYPKSVEDDFLRCTLDH